MSRHHRSTRSFGAFGGVSYGSLGIPLWVRSIAQAASGSHPSSLVCDVRASFAKAPCMQLLHAMVFGLELSVFNAVIALVLGAVLLFFFKRWREESAAYAAFERRRVRIARLEELSHALPRRGYTESELHAYNGSEPDRPILIGADGQVYNVSRGCDDFYGPDGCYTKLAGRDASRLLAKGILEPESARDAKVPLQPFELSTLRGWCEHYETKCAPRTTLPSQMSEPSAARTHANARCWPRALVQVRAARSAAGFGAGAGGRRGRRRAGRGGRRLALRRRRQADTERPSSRPGSHTWGNVGAHA